MHVEKHTEVNLKKKTDEDLLIFKRKMAYGIDF